MDQTQSFVPDFILHGQLLLTKSVESDRDVQAGTAERRLIYGEITNENMDEDDEQLIAKALDFSYFDTNGFIKYEHVANDPTHIIGAPHERITTPSGGTLIKGALFNNMKYADATWKLIQSLEEHNRLYPEHQKTLGWSVEGRYTDNQIEKGGFRKAQVVNVVITPNPVNKSVYLHAVAENHRIFAKSLMVNKAMSATPTSTNLAEKTGVDAIAKEQIDGEIKETAEDIGTSKDVDEKKKKKKKESELNKSRSSDMKFENLQVATKHFTDLGEDDAKATELAKSFFTPEELAADKSVSDDTNQELVAEVSTLSKSISDLVGKFPFLGKSKVGDGDDGVADADEFETIQSDEDGDFINVADTMLFLQKGMEDLTQLLREKVQYDVERDVQMAKALDGIGVLKTELTKSIADIQSFVTVGEGENAIPLSKAIEVVLKSRAGSVIDLGNLQIANEDQQIEKVETGKPMAWGAMQKILSKGLANEVITVKQQSIAETAFRTREWSEVRNITDLVQD